MTRPHVSQDLAAAELWRRRRARESLVDYSEAIEIPGAPVNDDPDSWLFRPITAVKARHHVLILEALQRCILADYGRLMIFAPPGSAKSSLASVLSTTWAMGKFPGLRVLMTSYASGPIIRHAKRARTVASSQPYRTTFGTGLAEGTKAADEWALENGSSLFAAGLMGGLTSARCDYGLVDDPVAGREEADSELVRSKTLEAYEDDFLSRLTPKASIVLIQTRWHLADLAGSLLPEDYRGESGTIRCRDGLDWEVLSIPARCEQEPDPVGRKVGEYLWPEWFPPEHWAQYEIKPRTWSALYQQRPAPEAGLYFKREDVKRYVEKPALRIYMASDFAVTKRGGDYTEHGVFGVAASGDVYLLDWWSGQVSTDEGIGAALALALKWKPVLWVGEKGVIESSIGPQIRRMMREANVFVARELLKTIGDKVARSRAFAGRMSAGMVYFPNTAWADAVILQLCAFPVGTHDDKVDVCGLIGRALDVYADPAVREKVKTPRLVVPFTEAWFAARDARDAADVARKARYYR